MASSIQSNTILAVRLAWRHLLEHGRAAPLFLVLFLSVLRQSRLCVDHARCRAGGGNWCDSTATVRTSFTRAHARSRNIIFAGAGRREEIRTDAQWTRRAHFCRGRASLRAAQHARPPGFDLRFHRRSSGQSQRVLQSQDRVRHSRFGRHRVPGAGGTRRAGQGCRRRRPRRADFEYRAVGQPSWESGNRRRSSAPICSKSGGRAAAKSSRFAPASGISMPWCPTPPTSAAPRWRRDCSLSAWV